MARAGCSVPAPLSEAPAAPVWAPAQRLLRAFFVGGTLGYEALTLLAPTLALGSNLRVEGVAETLSFRYPGHLVLDMGEGGKHNRIVKMQKEDGKWLVADCNCELTP